MKPFKNTSLYSRLALITSITLVVGYFVVYAAWTNLSLLEVESGDTITASLMQNIVNKINDIGARTDGITSTGITRDSFTSNVAWSPITAAAGWTSSASCRRIGSFLQIKGYIYYTANSTYTWNTQVATLPSECWPTSAISAPAGSCWADVGGSGEFACHSSIGTDGKIYLLTQSTYSFRYFSFAGTYPAN